MMAEPESENGHKGWNAFLRKHWKIAALFVVLAVLAVVGAILVFLWRVADAQSTGMVPTTLGLWTMEHMVTFTLHLIFWELLLIGIPAVIGAVAGWQWWKKLPNEEKQAYHFFGSGSRTTSGGSGVSILFFIAFCIKLYIDGNWDIPVASWTFDYVVNSMITILIWTAIIFGIPAALGVIWWISHEMKKKTSTEPNQTTNTP
jgi:flagellar basal body-associated protein FliL